MPHALTGTFELTHEQQFSPTLTGLGTRSPVSIYDPNPFAPVTGVAVSRTGAFTDGERTGSYRRGFSAEERTNLRISRADVADFVVSQLTDDTWLRRTPAVAYG